MGILKNLFSKKQETLKPPHKPDYTEVHTEEIARLTEESPIKQEELTPTLPPQEEPKRPKGIIKTQRHKLDNVEAYMKEIMELVEENEDYKLSKKAIIDSGMENEKIYQYVLSEKAKLLFEGVEPIQVFVGDVHIGDIKKGSRARVKKLIESGTIRDVETEVSGGHYKIVRYDSGRNEYFYDKLEDAFCITIEITYREEIKEDVKK